MKINLDFKNIKTIIWAGAILTVLCIVVAGIVFLASAIKSRNNKNNPLDIVSSYFYPNIGQATDKEALFVNSNPGVETDFSRNYLIHNFELTKVRDKNIWDFLTRKKINLSNQEELKKETEKINFNLKLSFLNANQEVEILTHEKTDATFNSYSSVNGKEEMTGVNLSKSIIYKDLYENTDLIYETQDQKLKSTFVVRKGGNSEKIFLSYNNAEEININKKGDLEVKTNFGKLTEQAPLAYQLINDQKKTVDAKFTKINAKSFGFKIGEYDKNLDLYIDPTIIYVGLVGSGYLNSFNNNIGIRATSGYGGNTYVLYDRVTPQGNYSCVAKMNGFSLSFESCFVDFTRPSYGVLKLSGAKHLKASGYGVDVVGQLISNYNPSGIWPPVTTGAFQTTNYGGSFGYTPGFVARLSLYGQTQYFSYFSHLSDIDINKVSIDSAGTIYGLGFAANDAYSCSACTDTYAAIPTTSGAYMPNVGDRNFWKNRYFAFKLRPNGGGASDLIYSSYLPKGFRGNPVPSMIASGGQVNLDASDGKFNLTSVSIGSAGCSPGYNCTLPITSGALQTNGNATPRDQFGYEYGQKGYYMKINPMGNGSNDLIYATFFGSETYPTVISDLRVNGMGNAFITGITYGSDLRVSSNPYKLFPGASGGYAKYSFASVINPYNSGNSSLVYSTYIGKLPHIGGMSWSEGNWTFLQSIGDAHTKLAIDSYGNMIVGANAIAMQTHNDRTKYSYGECGTPFTWCKTYPITDPSYSFNPDQFACAIAVSSDCYAFDVALTKIAPNNNGESDLLYGTAVGGSFGDIIHSLDLDSSNNIYLSGLTNSPDFGTPTALFLNSGGTRDFTNIQNYISKVDALPNTPVGKVRVSITSNKTEVSENDQTATIGISASPDTGVTWPTNMKANFTVNTGSAVSGADFTLSGTSPAYLVPGTIYYQLTWKRNNSATTDRTATITLTGFTDDGGKGLIVNPSVNVLVKKPTSCTETNPVITVDNDTILSDTATAQTYTNIKVTNNDNCNRVFNINITKPSGWTTAGNASTYSANANSQTTPFNLTVTPPSAATGLNTISITATNQATSRTTTKDLTFGININSSLYRLIKVVVSWEERNVIKKTSLSTFLFKKP